MNISGLFPVSFEREAALTKRKKKEKKKKKERKKINRTAVKKKHGASSPVNFFRVTEFSG